MIPAEAVEAAMEAFLSESVARKGELGAQPMALLSALESAAPHIRAQALEDAADSRETERLFMFGWDARERLRTRAAAERGVE